MSLALSIYHRLPPASRSVVASLRGYYLNWWRYGKETERQVEAILARDYWSADEWRAWREERLAFVLHRAATRVPYYREQWNERRRRGDRASWEYLENWPVLEKDALRRQARAFVADDCSVKKMYHDHTSGTTGTSLNLWLKKETVKYWYALFEARSRRWYGLSRQDRWGILGGQLVVPVAERKPPFWIWNAGLNQLYLSVYHLSPALLPAYLEAIEKYEIRYLLGYSSALYALAEAALARGRRIKLEVAITNAEPLYAFQRETIETAFECPVRETYGMAEIVAAGSECERGRLHQWPDAGVLELDEATRDASGLGDFVATGLINADMPLVRYRLGDCGALSAERCACGRQLPLFSAIEGRRDDVLVTPDGRRVGRLDPVFKNDLPVKEAQIVQKSLQLILVKVVPADGFDERAKTNLSARIRERMGDVEVVYETVREIPRSGRGKFRAVVCELSPEEKSTAK